MGWVECGAGSPTLAGFSLVDSSVRLTACSALQSFAAFVPACSPEEKKDFRFDFSFQKHV
jgi:hypothetical protein